MQLPILNPVCTLRKRTLRFHTRSRNINMTQFSSFALLLCLIPLHASAQKSVSLSRLSLDAMSTGWGTPQANRSVGGRPLSVGGVGHPAGIGTHANSKWTLDLGEAALRFRAKVGVDDEESSGSGTVTFEVRVDGQPKFKSGVMKRGEPAKVIDLDLTGAKRLTLLVGDGGDGIAFDHADWLDAEIEVGEGSEAKIKPFAPPITPPRLKVLPPNPKPEIHGARVAGGTPGLPFQFLIPATGEAPLSFSASGLPPGITLNPQTGLLTGAFREVRPKPEASAKYEVRVTVKNARGTAQRKLRLIFGEEKLALTPPMGWNSWNCWAGAVDAQKIRLSTDAMLASGLAAHGFQYINIDDCWQGNRREDGEIKPNDKFGDLKALADYVHSKGLKIGLYSSPGPKTCAGFEGSWKHEMQDAKTYAAWGFDYLKHDWCSYGIIETGNTLEGYQKPYRAMKEALRNSGRDIVYSLCQYGMGEVWKWGAEVDGNLWRTTGDIEDSWSSLHGIYEAQAGHEKYAGPGRWNDPDMLIVGKVGWGNPHPSRLTPNEQVLHISMWSLLASPLLIGCDLNALDPLTLALLSNDEVLDLDQDPLGRAASRLQNEDGREIWARDLYDGTVAVGLVNSGEENQKIMVRWSLLGRKSNQPVRDLWLHQNLGTFSDGYFVEVPAHGAVLLKVGKPRKTEYD